MSMPARRTYTREWAGIRPAQVEAVRAAERSGNAAQTARDLGIRPALVHRWTRELRDDGRHAFSGNGVPRDEELARLKRENKRLHEENAIQKKPSVGPGTGPQSPRPPGEIPYDRGGAPPELCASDVQRARGLAERVLRLALALGVGPRGRGPSADRPRPPRRGGVRAVHRESRGTYGAPRVHAELRGRGVACSKRREARLMREAGVTGKAPGRRKRTLASAPLGPVAENVLDRASEPDAPDRVWTADITQVWTGEGRLYLAVVLDRAGVRPPNSRRVVGWAARPSASRALVVEALSGALRSRRPAPGLVLHSDQGSQYTSHEYQTLLRQHGIVASMSRQLPGRGVRPAHNAPTESFFGTLKSEAVHGCRFGTQAELRSVLFDHIESFYNTRRRHTSLGFLTPAEHEGRHHQRQALTLAA